MSAWQARSGRQVAGRLLTPSHHGRRGLRGPFLMYRSIGMTWAREGFSSVHFVDISNAYRREPMPRITRVVAMTGGSSLTTRSRGLFCMSHNVPHRAQHLLAPSMERSSQAMVHTRAEAKAIWLCEALRFLLHAPARKRVPRCPRSRLPCSCDLKCCRRPSLGSPGESSYPA